MIYIKEIINNKLSDFTSSHKIAVEYGFLITKQDDEVEQAYDGSWYLLGHTPEKPQSLIDKQRINELQAYLTSTDWYAVRYAETGVAIPQDVVTARASAREEISTLRVEGVI